MVCGRSMILMRKTGKQEVITFYSVIDIQSIPSSTLDLKPSPPLVKCTQLGSSPIPQYMAPLP